MARQRLCRAGVLLPLALVLIAASRAAAQASAPTAAYFVGSSQLSVTLSNNVALSSSVTNGDCRPAFAYYGRDNNTKGGAAPFSNCSVSGARVTLTLAAGVSYAGGERGEEWACWLTRQLVSWTSAKACQPLGHSSLKASGNGCFGSSPGGKEWGSGLGRRPWAGPGKGNGPNARWGSPARSQGEADNGHVSHAGVPLVLSAWTARNKGTSARHPPHCHRFHFRT